MSKLSNSDSLDALVKSVNEVRVDPACMYRSSSTSYGDFSQQEFKRSTSVQRKVLTQEFTNSFPKEYRPGQFPKVYMFAKSTTETAMRQHPVAGGTGKFGQSAWDLS